MESLAADSEIAKEHEQAKENKLQKKAWQRDVLRMIAIVAISGLVGLSFDQIFWGILAGLIISHGLTLHRLYGLFRWSQQQASAPQDSGLIGYSADAIIRRERRLTKKIKRQKKQLKRIVEGVESLQDGVLFIDQAGFISNFNRAACHLLGLKEDSDKGQHITNFLRAPRFVKYFNKGNYREPIDLESPYRSNLIVQVQVMKFGADQKVIIVRDITERQRVETMRQNFIADVSHELRTPLTVISGYLEMLGDAELNTATARVIHQMTGQAERMNHLVNDLLHLSKLESNNSGIGNAWFAFKPFCIASIDQLKTYTPLSSNGEALPAATIDCDFCNTREQTDPVADIEIYGFEEEFSSVVTNLITNAIKYGHKEGQAAEVVISAQRTALGLEIAIKDNGEGIAEHHLERLTERFYRVDESRESTVGGSGLGLAIVRHALGHHDAQLKIDSVLGQGSCFSFVIPNERIRQKDNNEGKIKSAKRKSRRKK